jgi:predicted amidohydrolase
VTRIALLQMTSGIVPEDNLAIISTAARQAARDGATILFTPEMSILLDRDRHRAGSKIAAPDCDPIVAGLARLAAEAGIDIALGSRANRAMYFAAGGAQPTTYDKIHMFDVDLADGETWRESNAYAAGEAVVVVEGTPVGRLGLAICYDLRFPALFEEFGRRRCDAIAVPAAFTVPTGQAHWHLLQRARAVEASAFVISAAQVGEHADGRRTYGHSLVVDPWGEVVLDMGGEAPGLGFADIDLARIADVRRQLPSLANRRSIPKSTGQ